MILTLNRTVLKMLDASKPKELADDKINVPEIMNFSVKG